MACEINNNPHTLQSAGRPLISTYDSGYEHSLDHYLDLKALVEASQESTDVPATFAIAA